MSSKGESITELPSAMPPKADFFKNERRGLSEGSCAEIFCSVL
jgi:hypothetical protein